MSPTMTSVSSGDGSDSGAAGFRGRLSAAPDCVEAQPDGMVLFGGQDSSAEDAGLPEKFSGSFSSERVPDDADEKESPQAVNTRQSIPVRKNIFFFKNLQFFSFMSYQ